MFRDHILILIVMWTCFKFFSMTLMQDITHTEEDELYVSHFHDNWCVTGMNTKLLL